MIALLSAMAFGQAAERGAEAFEQRHPVCAPPATQPDRPGVATQPDRGEESPVALLRSAHETFAAGNGRIENISGYIDPQTRPLTELTIGLVGEAAKKTDNVAGVVQDKLGKEQAEHLKGMGIPNGLLTEGVRSPLAQFADEQGRIDWDHVNVVEQNGRATVQYDGRPTGLVLVKRDNKWYFGARAEPDREQLAEAMAVQQQLFCGLILGLDQIEQKVRSGDLTGENFQQESVRIMREAQASAMRG